MTADNRPHPYECMFLLSQAVAADLNGAMDHIREIFRRAGAEVIALKKWDERRLAFEIDKQKRGVYILSYFTCPASSIDSIHRDVNLSEKIMRCMILRADHLTQEEMIAADSRQQMEDEARLRQASAEDAEIPELTDA